MELVVEGKTLLRFRFLSIKNEEALQKVVQSQVFLN